MTSDLARRQALGVKHGDSIINGIFLCLKDSRILNTKEKIFKELLSIRIARHTEKESHML